MNQQVNREHYRFGKYADKARFASYHYQIDETLKTNPESVLEVGVGDKVFANFLQTNTDIRYQSLDIAADLLPDVVGSVDSIPLPDNSFDTVCAFEILEHLPFELFEKSLLEMKRVAKKYCLISLPHYGPQIKILFKIPFIKEYKFAYKIPHHPEHVFLGEHYWEIGKKGYEVGKILEVFAKHFVVERHYVPFENQYHHFFILNTLK